MHVSIEQAAARDAIPVRRGRDLSPRSGTGSRRTHLRVTSRRSGCRRPLAAFGAKLVSQPRPFLSMTRTARCLRRWAREPTPPMPEAGPEIL
jgi:hypothetical protein